MAAVLDISGWIRQKWLSCIIWDLMIDKIWLSSDTSDWNKTLRFFAE